MVTSQILAEYISSNNTIEIDEKFKKEVSTLHPEFSTYMFDRMGRTSWGEGVVTDSGFNMRKTPRQTAKDGKKPQPQDMREDFVNNWSQSLREEEVYNRDPIPLSVYQSMSFDSKIKLGTDLISGFISRLQYEIVSSDPVKAAFTKHAIRRIYPSLVRDMVKYGMRNGFMFGEKSWKKESIKIYDEITKEVIFSGRALVPDKVKTLDPENNFSYYIDTRSDELVRVEQDQTGGKVKAPRKKIFWFALDKEYSNIFGTSRFKSAYQSWFYANGLEMAMLTKLDTTGEPILVVKFPPGKSRLDGEVVDNDVIAEELAIAVQSQKVVKMPSEVDKNGEPLWDIYYVELKNSENDPYMKALEYFDKKKVESIGLFGNMIVGEGNFSELDAKETMSLVMIESIVYQLEETIQKDLIDWITSYNFGPKHIDDVRIQIDRNSLGRSKGLMEVLKEMLRIAASEKTGRPKVMPSIQRIANILNIPTEEYADQVDRDLLDEQMDREEELRPKPAPAAGPNPVKTKQQDEDTNNRNRKTPDERDRGRPSANKEPK